MSRKPLKKILIQRAILISIIPFAFLILIVWVWLFPWFISNIEAHHKHLSQITALKTENYLIRSRSILQSVSNLFEASLTDTDFQKIVRAQMEISDSLKAIYVIGPRGKVKAVSLRGQKIDQEKELIGLDFSKSAIFKESLEQNKPIWSDSFLSVIGGGLSVALAIPGDKNVIIGEIDLELLAGYLEVIADKKDQLILVLDRRGQVIADQEGRLTAQQLNLKHLSIVKKGLNQTRPIIDDFKLNGQSMTGCIIKSELANWSVLVAVPKSVATKPIWTATILFLIILLGSILLAAVLMMSQAINLSNKFAGLAKYAEKISTGDTVVDRPDSNIEEFNALTDDIQTMAETIKRRERYNRILFSDSPIPLLVIDPDTLECVDGNDSVIQILGLSSHEELVGNSVLNFSAADQENGRDSESAARQYTHDAVKNGSSHFEWIFKTSADEKLYAEINLSSFHHSDKTFAQVSINDITGRKIEESRRKQLEKQLRQAQKMESIGTLAGGIAHDFNNILFPVMGFTEMMMEDLPEDDQFQMPLHKILNGCLRAKELVGQILAFSRQTEKKYQPVKLDLILKEIIKLIRASLPPTIEIQKQISTDLGLVLADPTQIHQIMMNLITNAYHAMEETGGVLLIKLESSNFSISPPPVPDLSPGRYVCLTISDSGCGIDDKILENIFDPYFTTKGKGKGTGLGLSVVHGIVEDSGGKLLVESQKDKGTTMKVFLPEASPTQIAQIEEDSDIDLTATGHILLVDDEVPVLNMTEGMIRRFGYTVTSTDKSRDALKKFSESPDSFDLVITDMVMPELTGDRLTEEIKKIRPNLPVILLTGFSEKIHKNNSLKIQVDKILMKPVLKKNLGKAILKAMGKNRSRIITSPFDRKKDY